MSELGREGKELWLINLWQIDSVGCSKVRNRVMQCPLLGSLLYSIASPDPRSHYFIVLQEIPHLLNRSNKT